MRAARTHTAWAAVAVALLAANMRPAVASVGPVLDDIRRGLQLSSAETSFFTTVPVLCFGLLAPVAPRLAHRLGMGRALIVLLAAVSAGLLVRVTAGTAVLYAGTVLATGGIAAANVLLPALVKRDFPSRVGLMMGIYTLTLTGFAALAAGVTAPVERDLGHGWRGALAVWVLPAIFATAWWVARSRRQSEPEAGVRPSMVPLLRDPVAWYVTGFFGMQSLGFYSVLSWLPTLYRDHGYSATSAGALLSLTAVIQMPVALVAPSLAARSPHQQVHVAVSAALTAVGFAGLLFVPTVVAPFWVIVLGIGQGSSFPIGLTLVVLRTTNDTVTAQLSAMSQTIGYLIAAVGPLLVGALHAATGSWNEPMALLLALVLPQLVLGLLAALPRTVRSSE